MRLFQFFSRVASGVPLQAPLKLTCHSPVSPQWVVGRKNHKIGIGCIPQRMPGKTLYNTALTDGHLILTVVFPQMEMFFLLPALYCDEVVSLLFVTRYDMLWMSSFILFALNIIFKYKYLFVWQCYWPLKVINDFQLKIFFVTAFHVWKLRLE